MLAARRVLLARSITVARAFSAQSSFFEPNPSLFHPTESLKSQIPGKQPDALLREDVRTMGSLLGNIIEQRQGKDTFDKVEKLRHLAKVSRLLTVCR